ncbi:MAG: AzlD domain-containing protein [Microbacteriaceae bacterium]
MTLWHIVLLASIAVLALKLVGYLVPQSVLEKAAPARIAQLLTVALLAALVAVQTLAAGTEIVLDARVPALLVAVGLFALRAPFILVIIAAATTAAVIRAVFPGW